MCIAYSHQVFDGSVRVVEAGSHGVHALLPREAHLHHVLDGSFEMGSSH